MTSNPRWNNSQGNESLKNPGKGVEEHFALGFPSLRKMLQHLKK